MDHICNIDAVFSNSLIRGSDHCFDDFISPMINFVFFEDPRTLTELRPIFVHHNLPQVLESGITADGSVQLYAFQIRLALTERLSLIAVKDGLIVEDVDGATDSIIDDGIADVAIGLKYNLIRDDCNGTLLSAGFTYEIPIGSNDAQQGVGDGEFHYFATGGQRLMYGDAHLLSSFGWRQPVNTDTRTSSVHWSSQLDYRLSEQFYILTGVTWWHWTDSASTGLPLGVAGQDLFNFASTNVTNNNLVTQNVGVKWKPSGHIEAGLAYEFPLSGFEDVIESRVQAELIWRY